MKLNVDQIRYVTDGPVPEGKTLRIGSAWTKKPSQEPLEVDVSAGTARFEAAGKLRVVPLANIRDLTVVD